MNLSEEVDLEDYVGRPDKISNAEISAICQEAGMHAVRKNRYSSRKLKKVKNLEVCWLTDPCRQSYVTRGPDLY